MSDLSGLAAFGIVGLDFCAFRERGLDWRRTRQRGSGLDDLAHGPPKPGGEKGLGPGSELRTLNCKTQFEICPLCQNPDAVYRD